MGRNHSEKLLCTPILVTFLLCWLYVLCLHRLSVSAQSQAKMDETEAKVLASISRQWNKTFSTQSGNSTDFCNQTHSEYENTKPDFKLMITCNCSFENNTICHVIRLEITDLTYATSTTMENNITEEIGKLKHLNNLTLSHNYVSGPLPHSIGNLTELQILDVGFNNLIGSIPKEIGTLQNLTTLSLRSNSFIGSLPTEIGNLHNLKYLYVDSCGLNGTIPPSLINLKNLENLFLSDNNFTGKIPDFIGSFSNLKELRMQGNSFQGPIPSNFSNLKLVNDLRISEISGEISRLTFIKNMTSLRTLILRNNWIADTIPTNIDEFKNLELLDLSFNNISGNIPDSLFRLSLKYLFLGNNSLTGSLPLKKSSSLSNIDVSYNLIFGSFPPWVNDGIQFNMLFNNFEDNLTKDSAYTNFTQKGKCLQRKSLCSQTYYNLSINCGGNELSFYVDDDTKLGSASYNVTNRFAVSNVGNINVDTDLHENGRSFLRTRHSELFQNARMSMGSIRYYILNLTNGTYGVKLEFAETVFGSDNKKDWTIFGRRVFDIYIQGVLQLKDFNIAKEARGLYTIIIKEFTVTVSNGILEIHLFWGGKGTCCVPSEGTYGPLISALEVESVDSTTSSETSEAKRKKIGLIVGVVVGVAVLSVVVLTGFLFLPNWWKKKMLRMSEGRELLAMKNYHGLFDYAELRVATNDFNPENKIGEGGFGPVYRGVLSDGRLVAVKNHSETSHQGNVQFIAEIASISSVQHRNLVKLYGCCIEDKRRILVYEYLENGSLDQALFEKNGLILNWATRYNICLGTARALVYLHEKTNPRIVHRDIKASNVLLDVELSPKISDFGLAKLYDGHKTHMSTAVAGTTGYIAPEYAMRGHLSEKVDVFAYGILVLEILSGRPNADTNLDQEKIYLLDWVWNLHGKDQSLDIVDPNLSEINVEEATRLIQIALLCTQSSHVLRPSMSMVASMLSGKINVSGTPLKPGYLSDWSLDDNTSSSLCEMPERFLLESCI